MAVAGGSTLSLVSNILQKSSAFDERVIEEGIQQLSRKSSALKENIYDFLKENYISFDSYMDSTLSLEEKLRKISSEFKRLSVKVENDLRERVARSSEKREETERKLADIQFRIGFVETLVHVHDAIVGSKADLQDEKYASAAERLVSAREHLGGSQCEARVYAALDAELSCHTSDLADALTREWNKLIVWRLKEVSETSNPSAYLHSELKLPLKSGMDRVSEVIAASSKLTRDAHLWQKLQRQFAQRLLEAFIKPLICFPEHLELVKQQEKLAVVLKFKKPSKGASSARSLATLYNSILSIFKAAREAIPSEYQEEWTEELGQVVCPEMAELLIKNSLAESVPGKSSELKEYKTVITNTEKFERSLTDLGIVGMDYSELSEYAKNINSHFAAKQCQSLLLEARELLKRPVEKTVLMKPSETATSLQRLSDAPLSSTTATAGSESGLEEKFDELKELSFQFPTCLISESVKLFVDLLYDTLQSSLTSSFSSATQQFNTARYMVDLFCAVMPSYHKPTVSKQPKLALVQHNNCMYVAHHLITLGHQFYSRLPEPLNNGRSTLIDFVFKLRALADEFFTSEMEKQRKAILDSLRFDLLGSEEGEKAIQATLGKISELSNIYFEVIPVSVHHKAVGALLNAVLVKVVGRVLGMEDISMDEATELYHVLEVVIEKGPSVLLLSQGQPDSVSQYCKEWGKVKQLAAVLNAGLQEIVEMWSAGSGPLAKDFTAGEVRGMVKALFQNTERRAAALSKISVK